MSAYVTATLADRKVCTEHVPHTRRCSEYFTYTDSLKAPNVSLTHSEMALQDEINSANSG